MSTNSPAAGALRATSDESVLRLLMGGHRMTRAELAAASGLSKPTVGAAVARLVDKGLLRDTGEHTTGRGGVGTFYALGDSVGVALVVSVRPEGVVAEVIDAAGVLLSTVERDLPRLAGPGAVRRALVAAARAAVGQRTDGTVWAVVVSAADPVDRESGRLVHLPDAPFLVGDLDPRLVLGRYTDGPVIVDNDVNWAAEHERAARSTADRLDDFVYLHLGEGVGCAVVSDGRVRRGHSGLAGEVAHLITPGPRGIAMPFTAVFDRLGVRLAGTTAIDVRALETELGKPKQLAVVAAAVAGVVSAAVGLCDPGAVILAGAWGTSAVLLDAVQRLVQDGPRPVPIHRAFAGGAAAHLGARASALALLQNLIAARSR